MAGIQVPQFRQPIDYLTEGTKGLNDIFNRVRAAALEQQKINDMVNYHKSEIGLRGAAEGRAAELHPYALQAAQDAHMLNLLKYDPEAQMNMINGLIQQYGWGSPSNVSQQPSSMGAPSSLEPSSSVDNRPYVPDQGDFQNADGSWNGGSMQDNGINQPQKNIPGAVSSPLPSIIDAAQKGDPKAQMLLGAINKVTGNKFGQVNTKETPEQKMQRDLATNQAKLEQKAKMDQEAIQIKERKALEKELPIQYKKLQEIQDLKKLIKKHPDWFGSGVLGFDFLGGPNQRKRGINDADYGKIETMLGALIGPQSQEFSSKGLAAALNLAKEIKPGFGENANIALGKLSQIEKRLQQSVREDKKKLSPLKSGSSGHKESHINDDPLGLGI